MNIVNKIGDGMERGLTYFSMSLLAFMVVLVFILVIARYFFHVAFPFGAEVARVSLVALTFLMAGVLVKRQRHITLDLLFARFPSRVKNALHLTYDLLTFFVAAFWLWGSINLVQLDIRLSSLTREMEWPLSAYHSLLILAFLLLLIYSILQLYKDSVGARK